MSAAVQLAEDKHAPEKSPELIGVGERNAAADADVFGGVLLEEIADDPDEAAEHEPEEHVARTLQFAQERRHAEIADRERGHHAELAKSEKCDEGKRVHAGEIGFAVGDVHRAPEDAGAERGPDSAKGMRGGSLC